MPARQRWLRPSPGMLIAGSLAAVAFVWLCQRFDWFDAKQYQGWPELIAVGIMAATLSLLLAWWLAALTFRWRFQLPLRNLLVVFVACSIVGNWFAARYGNARRQADATNQIERIGGQVGFDRWLEKEPADSSSSSLAPSSNRWPIADAGEEVLAQGFLGNDFFRRANFVFLEDRKIGDSALGYLGEFANFRGGVSLDHSAITDAGLARVAALDDLELLDISDTRITDSGLARLVGLGRLDCLVLDDTKITDTGLQYVGQIAQLSDLRMNHDRISGGGLKHLTNLAQLRKLGASYTDITDAALASIGKLKHLDSLWLAGTNVTNAGLAHLSGCTELQTLCLDETQVTGEGIDCLRGLEHLTACSLNNAAVSDVGLQSLSTLEHLEELDLGSANISDVSLNYLTALPNLRSLSLRGCTIYNYATAPHARFRNLQSLNVTSICVEGEAIDWSDWVSGDCDVCDRSR